MHPPKILHLKLKLLMTSTTDFFIKWQAVCVRASMCMPEYYGLLGLQLCLNGVSVFIRMCFLRSHFWRKILLLFWMSNINESFCVLTVQWGVTLRGAVPEWNSHPSRRYKQRRKCLSSCPTLLSFVCVRKDVMTKFYNEDFFCSVLYNKSLKLLN